MKKKQIPLFDVNTSNKDKTITTRDAFSNTIANLGSGSSNVIQGTKYERGNLSQNGTLLTTLYLDNWVVQRIVQAVPDSIISKWFEIVSSINPAKVQKMNDMFNHSNIKNQIKDGMKWGRLYGGAIGIMLIKGHENKLDTPLQLDDVILDSFCGMHIIDRWYGVNPSIELVTDFGDIDFGLPMYYNINTETNVTNIQVHHSRVVRFIGRDLPPRMKPVHMYWGTSEIQSIFEELIRRDNTAANIASLVFKANLSVYQVEDLDQILSSTSADHQQRFWSILSAQSAVESSMGIKVMNSTDSIQNLQYSFAGLKDIYESIKMDVAAASSIPATKLFGKSPEGMNATGESDMNNYYEYVDEVRSSQFGPIIHKMLPIMAMSSIGEIPEDLDYTLPPMQIMDAATASTISAQSVTTLLELYGNNLVTGAFVLEELQKISKSVSMFSGISSEMVEKLKDIYSKDNQPEMDDPMSGLMGQMDQQQ